MQIKYVPHQTDFYKETDLLISRYIPIKKIIVRKGGSFYTVKYGYSKQTNTLYVAEILTPIGD